jgi:D-psicose/D-tagatose/L-ribulose 3-epimerase
MTLSVSDLAWDLDEDAEAIAAVVRSGGRAIDVAPTKLWSDLEQTPIEDAHAYAAVCRSRGVRIRAVQSLLFGKPSLELFGEPEQRSATLAYLEHVIALGAGLGASYFLYGAAQNRLRHGRSHETCMDSAAIFFRELAEAAGRASAVFCVEPLAPEYGCDFVRNTAEAVQLAEAVNHPAFGILLDTGVLALASERLEDAVSLAGSYLRYVHLAEPHLHPISTAERAADIRRLRRLGYDGWVSVEMLGTNDGENVPRVAEAVTQLAAVA